MRAATVLAFSCFTFCAGCSKGEAGVPEVETPDPLSHDWVTIQHVRVRLDRVVLGKVPMTRRNPKGESDQVATDKPYLAVFFTVGNLSDERRIDGLFRTAPTLKLVDETGAQLRDVNLWDMDRKTMVSVRPQGQVEPRIGIDPNTSVSDMITFEPPGDSVKTLTLTLPGSAVMVEGDFTFTIPVAAWR